MAFVIALTVIFFLAGFIYGGKKGKRFYINDAFILGVPSSALGFVLGILLFLLSSVICSLVAPKEDVIEEYPIYALNDNCYVSSSLKNGKRVYTYLAENEKGKYIDSVTSDEVYIVEGSETPVLRVHKEVFAKEWLHLIALESVIKEDELYYYEFYVPAGTISYNFKIDLE